MEKQERQRLRQRSIVRDFCLNTSAHGLPSIARNKSIHIRLFWSISFVGFMGIMIFFIVKAILAFFEYPTNIDVTYIRQPQQYFPAFSLCNMSPGRLDEFIDPFLNYTHGLNLTRANDTNPTDLFKINYIYDFMIEKVNKNESTDSFYFSLTSMLHTCSFNNQPCSAMDFISFASPIHGLCHTFNAKMKNTDNDTVRLATQNGGEGRLTLGLYVHSHQYIPSLVDATGIVALVHDNTQLPLIETAGIELAPGKRHKLGYKRKIINFLPPPFTMCTDKLSPVMEAMFENYHDANYGYSETICYQLCQQAYSYEQCGCVNPYLWNARSVTLSGSKKIISAPLCNTSNNCYVQAFNRLLASESLTNQYCSICQGQCSITDCIVQISASKVPQEWQMNDIKNFVENSTIRLPENWTTTWREHIYSNYLAVTVVRETNLIETNTQKATIEFVDLLSNIGGQTGLWIGISFLSLMEVIEMLWRLIQYQWSMLRDMNRNAERSAATAT